MVNVSKEGFGNTNLGLSPSDLFPELSPDIQQTLARVLGWDENNKTFRLALVDVDGRLLVSTSPTQGTTGVNSSASVTTTSAVVLAANTSRRQVMLFNNSVTDIFIGFGSSVVLATGFPIPAKGGLILDTYLGAISAIVVSGTADLRIVEF